MSIPPPPPQKTPAELDREARIAAGIEANRDAQINLHPTTAKVTDAMRLALEYATLSVAEFEAEAREAANAERLKAAADKAAGYTPNKHEITKRRNATAAHTREMVLALANELAPAAMLQLAQIASDPMQHGAVRISAIDKIHDRTLGKATTPMSFARDDLYRLPVAEAVAILGAAAATGAISQEEVQTHLRLLDVKVRAVETEALAAEIAELRSMLTGGQTITEPARLPN